MVQQEGKTERPVLPDSNEKGDDLLSTQLNPWTAPPLPPYGGPVDSPS